MRLSYSAISTYQKCPLAYKFQYIEKVPTKPSHYLSFGSSVHSALEFFYNVKVAQPCSLERLLQELEKVWKSDGYESESREQEYKEKGRAILTLFYHENVPSFTVPVAVEKRFLIDLDGIKLSGVIDRITRLASGGLEIIDYKTNEKLPPPYRLKEDLQLPIYHMAAEQLYGKEPDKVTLYFLVPNEKISTKKTKRDITQTRQKILRVADSIQKQKFEPLKNPLCPWCDFIELCPLHADNPAILAKAAANGKISIKKQSNINFTPVEGIASLKQSAMRIEKVVDEYIELADMIKKARLRLDELQTTIHDYCEKNKLSSVSGTQGKLARKAKRTTHYNVDKLRELLEPRGLWEKVLDVNGQLLKKVLDDEASQSELRKLIDLSKEIEEISYVLYIKDEIKE